MNRVKIVEKCVDFVFFPFLWLFSVTAEPRWRTYSVAYTIR